MGGDSLLQNIRTILGPYYVIKASKEEVYQYSGQIDNSVEILLLYIIGLENSTKYKKKNI